MSKHVRKFHSEAAKRKANDTAELHADKVPRLSDEHETGGAVTTRGMKREVDEEEESKQEVKMAKPDVSETTKDTNDEYQIHSLWLMLRNWDQPNDGSKMRSQPEIYSDVRPTTWTQGRGRFEYWSNTCIGCCDGQSHRG